MPPTTRGAASSRRVVEGMMEMNSCSSAFLLSTAARSLSLVMSARGTLWGGMTGQPLT